MGDGVSTDSTDDASIDCRAVVEELYTFLDGELSDGRRVQIERHYTGCSGCHEIVEFHASLKMTIAAKCQEPVPDALRQRIRDALRAAE
jgi:mycothiol system anti-sigma-R factor